MEEAKENKNYFSTPHRVGFLREIKTLDGLLDAFQSDGIPMGSNRWAEYCQSRLLELQEKERTLAKILRMEEPTIESIKYAAKYCGSQHHRNWRRRMTEEFQEESRDREKLFDSLISPSTNGTV